MVQMVSKTPGGLLALKGHRLQVVFDRQLPDHIHAGIAPGIEVACHNDWAIVRVYQFLNRLQLVRQVAAAKGEIYTMNICYQQGLIMPCDRKVADQRGFGHAQIRLIEALGAG